MKIKTSSLAIILGSVVGVGAIERPGQDKTPVPEEPKGGILGNQSPSHPEGSNERENAPKQAETAKTVAYLGVSGEVLSEALRTHLEIQDGLLLDTVDPTSPAGLSGLKQYDIILAVGEAKISNQQTLREAVSSQKPGDTVVLKLIRRGKRLEEEITLGEAPAVRNVAPMALVPDQAADMSRLMNERLGMRLGGLGGEDLQRELMEQLKRAMGDQGRQMRQLRFQFQNNGQVQGNGLQKFGSVRLEDREGSVEMKMNGDDRIVIVRDHDKNVLFEGPYNTEDEKNALPKEFRERVERLDMDNGNSRLDLNFGDLIPGNEEGE